MSSHLAELNQLGYSKTLNTVVPTTSEHLSRGSISLVLATLHLRVYTIDQGRLGLFNGSNSSNVTATKVRRVVNNLCPSSNTDLNLYNIYSTHMCKG